ncbi:MAG TPA: cytochrome c [Nannocystis sp.]
MVVVGLLAACEQGMRDQGRIDALEASELMPDGVGARHLPAGVVPRGQAALDRHLWEGRLADGTFARNFPFEIAEADLRRGRERFEIFCMPCHGRLGDGDGMAVRRGYPAPPPFSAERVVARAPGEIFDVVTRGHAVMPDYDHIPVEDRWRIVAWVQVLQFSQQALVSALPPPDRVRLGEVLP